MTRRFCLALLACVLGSGSTSLLAAAPKGAPKGPPPRFEMRGHIDGFVKGRPAVVRISGRAERSASVRSDGTFLFRSLPPGSYSVRPESRHYRFSPSFHTVALTSHDVAGVQFTAHLHEPPKPLRR
jgi:hypothetical protein